MTPLYRIAALLRKGLLPIAMALAVLPAACDRNEGADDTVVIALANDVATLDPHKTSTVAVDLGVLSHVYPALVTRKPDGKLHPDLAQSWTRLSDTHWRFQLVPEARFANGEALDAAAVAWNLERVLNPDNGARIRTWFTSIKTIDVVDATTIDIHTHQAFAPLVDQLSMLFLLPPQWASRNDPAVAVMPGGPYRLVERRHDEFMQLERNPSYFGPAPAIERVRFAITPSATARVAALLAGEVDMITQYPQADIKRIQASGKARADTIVGLRTVFIKFNTEVAPLNDPIVRRALNLAVDKQAISRNLFGGQAQVLQCQLLTPDYLGFNPSLAPYGYDPHEARRLLRQSNYDFSQPITLQVPTNYTPQGEEVAQAVASQLQAVGLNIRLHQMEPSLYMSRYIQERSLAPLSLLTHAWPTLDADGILSLLKSDAPHAYYDDAVHDQGLAEARAELDADARRARYAKVTQHLCEQAPVLFLHAPPVTYGLSKRVHWKARGDDWIRAMDLTLIPQ